MLEPGKCLHPGRCCDHRRSGLRDCSNLATLTLPDSVTSVGLEAFENCGDLTNISIGSGLTNIATGWQDAFSGCTNLTSISVSPENSTFAAADGILFDKSRAILLDCAPGKTGSYTIPDSVTNIAPYAFVNCVALTNLALGTGIADIETNCFAYNGSLGSVIMPNSVTNIDFEAFYKCAGLMSVTIPGSVIDIGRNAFEYCELLTNVTVGNGVVSIGSWAFSDDPSLATVTLPNTVTDIGDSAFLWTGLNSIIIPDSVTDLGTQVLFDCYDLTNVSLPSGLTTLPDGTFGQCASLPSVTIPKTVTEMGEGVFNGCESLTNISLPSGLTTLPDSTFGGCSSLPSIIIPAAVTDLGDYAFYGCTALQKVIFLGNPPNAGSQVFGNFVAFDTDAVAYYLAGAKGWGTNFAGIPTAILASVAFTATPTNGVSPLTVTFSAPLVLTAPVIPSTLELGLWRWILERLAESHPHLH